MTDRITTLEGLSSTPRGDRCDGWFGACTVENIESWGRMIAAYRDAGRRWLDANPGDGPAATELRAWVDDAKVEDLAELGQGTTAGQEVFSEYGFARNSVVVDDMVAVALTGRSLLERAQLEAGQEVFMPAPTLGKPKGIGLGTIVLWGAMAWIGFKAYETWME